MRVLESLKAMSGFPLRGFAQEIRIQGSNFEIGR